MKRVATRHLKVLGQKLPGVSSYIKRKDELERVVAQNAKVINEQNNALGEKEKLLQSCSENILQLEAQIKELQTAHETKEIKWPVFKSDILKAFEKQKPNRSPKSKGVQPSRYCVNWVVPPMGQISGGHTDIFRTINYLEKKGYLCRVYVYDALGISSKEEVQRLLVYYPPIKSTIYYNAPEMLQCDALFATNWFTAYPVRNSKTAGKKFYFVQDFEPFFDPVGTFSYLAEETYKFGFHGITLNGWLKEKLENEYNMECDTIELGVDTSEYPLINTQGSRDKIIFYARPVTARRGFELGILALEQFNKLYPEYEINFAGWDTRAYKDIPFPYVNNGVLSPTELTELYNKSAAGLVLSFTNISLLPLDLMSAGCIPVVNDAESARAPSYAKYLQLANADPMSLARTLGAAAERNKSSAMSKEVADAANKYQWQKSLQDFERILRLHL